MSNVLIGIIGVILFIGLAIAGASILGSDFMTASASAQAASLSSQLQQFAQATQTLKIRRGVFIPSNIGSGLGTYLQSNKALGDIPINPSVPANLYYGATATGSSDSTEIRLIYTDIGTNQKARNTCAEIETQAGNTNPTTVVDNPTAFDARAVQAARVGCMMDTYLSNHYVAYIPV